MIRDLVDRAALAAADVLLDVGQLLEDWVMVRRQLAAKEAAAQPADTSWVTYEKTGW